MHRATGSVLTTAFALTLLAEACNRLDRTTEGLSYLTEAEQIIETTNDAFAEAELHRVRGDLLNANGDVAGAELSYQQAIAIAKRQSAKMFELRASTGLARLWRDQGKREEARELLAPVYGWFTEGFDTRDLKEAKALLGACPSSRCSSPSESDSSLDYEQALSPLEYRSDAASAAECAGLRAQGPRLAFHRWAGAGEPGS